MHSPARITGRHHKHMHSSTIHYSIGPTALEVLGNGRVVLPALELIVWIEIRILVVQPHHKPDLHITTETTNQNEGVNADIPIAP